MLIKEIDQNNPENTRLNFLKQQQKNLNKKIKSTKAQATIAKGQQQLAQALRS